LEICFSSAIAYRSSVSLRSYVTAVAAARCSAVSAFAIRLSFTYCWVMLEPPCWTDPSVWLRISARSVPFASSAPWE
jgi:hypothetical protein